MDVDYHDSPSLVATTCLYFTQLSFSLSFGCVDLHAAQ
jgi:hypothetical protein